MCTITISQQEVTLVKNALIFERSKVLKEINLCSSCY